MELSLIRGSQELALSHENGLVVMPGVEGLDTPPVSLGSVEPADFDGEFVTNVRYQARQIDVPVGLYAAGESEARGMTRALASFLNPQVGQTTLRVTHPAKSSGELLPVGVGFDPDVAAWERGTINVQDTVTVDTSIKFEGAQSLFVDSSTNLGSLGARLKEAAQPTVRAGATYRASAWFRAHANPLRYFILVAFLDASGDELGTKVGRVVLNNTTTWAQAEVEFSPPPGTVKVGLEVWSNIPRETGGAFPKYNYRFDSVSLVEIDTVREIDGYLSAPLGSALASGESTDWRRLSLQLRCPDPLFRGTTEATEVPPLGVVTSVFNSGDAIAWPVWRIVTASGFPVTVKNQSIPGQPTFTISDAVLTIDVNTNPRGLSVTNYLTNALAWSSLSADSVLFPLLPGVNTLSGTNVGGGFTIVTASFQTRWLTAW